MPAIHTLIRHAKITLRDAGIESFSIDATILACTAFHMTRERLLLDGHIDADARHAQTFRSYIERRAAYEPVAYITGRKDFRRLHLEVSPDTLIPRPDSECLPDAAESLFTARRNEQLRILDICTGSGCLLLSLIDYFPAAVGVGSDISIAALRMANANAHRLDLHTRVSFVQAHWTNGLTGSYDIICCNPPYIRNGDRTMLSRDITEYEPASALFAGADGMDAYAHILPAIRSLLAPEGYAFFECGDNQTEMLSAEAAKYGLLTERVLYDLSGSPRGAVFVHKPAAPS